MPRRLSLYRLTLYRLTLYRLTLYLASVASCWPIVNISLPARAVTTEWLGGNGNFNANTWSNGTPGVGDTAKCSKVKWAGDRKVYETIRAENATW